MDWTIELNKIDQYLLVTTRGKFRIEEQRKMFQEIMDFSGWCKCSPILFDNRLLDLSDSNPDIMRESAQINEKFITKYGIERLAGLVNDGVNFGIGRQFMTLFEIEGGKGFLLFKDFDLALKWLKKEID